MIMTRVRTGVSTILGMVSRRYAGGYALSCVGTSIRERFKQTHLNTRYRRQLCEIQGLDYSYDSLFAEIPHCILPELFATLHEDPGEMDHEMDPLRALVATVSSWTSLVDRRLMAETTLEGNRAQVKQLNERSSS